MELNFLRNHWKCNLCTVLQAPSKLDACRQVCVPTVEVRQWRWGSEGTYDSGRMYWSE